MFKNHMAMHAYNQIIYFQSLSALVCRRTVWQRRLPRGPYYSMVSVRDGLGRSVEGQYRDTYGAALIAPGCIRIV